MHMNIEHRRYLMGVAMFLMYMPLGMWLPSLPNILEAYDARWTLPYVFALMQLMGIVSSLLIAAISDRKMEAQKLLGMLSLISAGFLWLAFSSLEWGWHPGWYLFFQSCHALIFMPMISLIAKIKLVNLPNPEKSFPLYSMYGTLGWLIAGAIVSGLSLDASANTGRIGAFILILMGLVCALLPPTAPEDQTSKGWKAALGLEAFSILKNREIRVFYIASTLISILYVSFFMIVPTMLMAFGSEHPTVQMTIGQWTELVAMLLLSVVAQRYRIRSLYL